MKSHRSPHRVIVAGLIAAGIAAPVWGGEYPQAVTTAPGSSLSTARFYTASMVNVGEFPGTLVRLSCAWNESGGAEAQGEQPHGYALVMDGDDTIHPLLPGTDEVRSQLKAVDLQGTAVAVHGKYYPSTGIIFVSRIAVRPPAAAHREVVSKAGMDEDSAVGSNDVRAAGLAVCASH
jgi:hypothetical protein